MERHEERGKEREMGRGREREIQIKIELICMPARESAWKRR